MAFLNKTFRPHPFRNKKSHFDPYVKVRERIFAEVKFRRERQWDTLKWTCLTQGALLTAVLTFKTKSTALETMPKWALACVSILIAATSLYRIIHDSMAGGFYNNICAEMDKTFDVHFDDTTAKPIYKIELFVRSCWIHFYPWFIYVLRILYRGECWAKKQPVFISKLHLKPRIRNTFLYAQLLFILATTIAPIAMLYA
ncbi:hypothetical protein [Prosthecobacter vanneervenii]|uniref:Uncharacterized protein n=1 Tax=Prosthecobacter vanneervenii TaxID=48466 RepID=A0A7W7Y892_9BACT|nr:hypothetical protein [Prosthecobacter vanneervenii]MBB5031463.1 hypothetical protein [Prosthecobacter vanneervenii]